MIKQTISLPPPEIISDPNERLSPLEKIIATENLSYIPNLYFRKYKLIEALNHEKYDFPQQKLLIPRPKSLWDALLCEVKEKAELRKEVKKFKMAQNYHVSRQAKQQFVKKQLKKEERYLFHRIVANQLSQDVQNFFKNLTNSGVSSAEINNTEKENESIKKDESFVNNSKGRGIDDIFIDKQADDDYLQEDNVDGIDFFDDILNDGVPQKQPALDLINGDNHRVVFQTDSKRSIKDHMIAVMELNQNLKQNVMDEEGLFGENVHISRKACLKRINQNLRKRLKTKGAEEEDRSLTSATVSLSNLINNYPEYKDSQNFVELPSDTQWIFDEGFRNKRKKDEQFQINWDEQQIQKFTQMNDKFQISKLKQMPTALQLTVQKKEYPKLFEKNISSNYLFPSNVESVRSFSSKFEKRKFYYNEFHDGEYERFIMKNNKKRLLQKFQRHSNYMFAQNYIQDEFQSNEKVSMGKMFLYPPNKISDRLIYKVVPGTTKLSVITKDYNKKTLPFSRQKIILLSFLVSKYLTEFGNNWKIITEFVQIFPCFSSYLIKSDMVQEFYQLINKHELKIDHLQNLQIWDKKMLPGRQLYDESYKNLQKEIQNKKSNKSFFKQQQLMTDQSAELDETQQKDPQFSLDNFDKYLKEPLKNKNSKKKTFAHLSTKFKQYGATLHTGTTNDTYNFYEGKIRKSAKIIEEYRNTYGVTKTQKIQIPQNEERISQYVQENICKGDLKNGLPYRKKKNINQRNNELVKILQALRSKTTSNVPPPGSQKISQQMNKMPGIQQKIPSSTVPQQLISTSITPPPTMQNLPANNKASQSQSQKQQKKTKTPQKSIRVGGTVKKTKVPAPAAASQPPAKKQGQQEKK